MSRKMLAFFVCGIALSTYLSPASAGSPCVSLFGNCVVDQCTGLCRIDSQGIDCLCEPSGACCILGPVVAGGPSNSCTETTEIECLDEGGFFHEGTTCDDDPCTGCPGTGGDCCEPNDTPGCDDVECCELVCACDDFCCGSEWDEFCAGTGFGGSGCGAAVLCEACIPPPCGEAEAPACNGSCDVGEVCVEDDGPTAGANRCICVQAEVGACCQSLAVAGGGPIIGCIDTTRTECEDNFGNYKGDGTSCEDEPDPCQEPTGACCLVQLTAGGEPDSDCIETTSLDCALSGNYKGDGTSCDDVPHPCRGACCLIAGCTEGNASGCSIFSGDYLGDGTTCDPDPCEVPTGACCDPISGGCSVSTEQSCGQSFTGVYQGDGTTCDPNPCVGACCRGALTTPDTVSCSIETSFVCVLNFGGIHQGNGTTCDPDPCEAPTGACCSTVLVAGNGDPISTCVDATREECDSNFGNYKGDGTSCDDDPDPCLGACCPGDLKVAGTNGCTITDEYSCFNFFNGQYLGDGTTCEAEPNPCVACGDSEAPTCGGLCEPGFVCEPANGFATAGIDECACIPERGACCLIFDLVVAGPLTCEVMDRSECESIFGDFKGHGTTCEPNPCEGACCLDPVVAGVNGGCTITDEFSCSLVDGVYQGDGTECDPDPCLDGSDCCVAGDCTDPDCRALVCACDSFCCDDWDAACAGPNDFAPGCSALDLCEQCMLLSCEESDFPACGGSCPQGETCVPREDFVTAGIDASCRCVPLGACCLPNGDCEERPEDECEGEFRGVGTTCAEVTCLRPRGNPTQKGSLLYFSKIEIKWNAAGELIQDTFVDITNDYPQGVNVQAYFINGDIELPELTADEPGGPRDFEPGWNTADCRFTLTANQPHFWSAANGSDKCQPFTVLDDDGPGRLDPEANDGSRILRGFAIFFAVDFFTIELENPGTLSGWFPIRWNHLKGDAVLVNYANKTAWEYNAWAFRLFGPPHGCALFDPPLPGCDPIEPVGADHPPAALLVDFYASGSTALSGGSQTVMVDTDLTLHAISLDLRQDGCGPVLTKVEAEIWNEFESKFSGTRRCICCWDQTMISQWSRSDAVPNHFLRSTLGTDKGMARLRGVASVECDYLTHCGPTAWEKRNSCELSNFFDRLPLPFGGEDAAILGLATKFLSFTPSGKKDTAGMNLVGMGEKEAVILFDLQFGPDEFHTGRSPIARGDGSTASKGATVQTGPTMTIELGRLLPKVERTDKNKGLRDRGTRGSPRR